VNQIVSRLQARQLDPFFKRTISWGALHAGFLYGERKNFNDPRCAMKRNDSLKINTIARKDATQMERHLASVSLNDR
jgi:hypothetical protein